MLIEGKPVGTVKIGRKTVILPEELAAAQAAWLCASTKGRFEVTFSTPGQKERFRQTLYYARRGWEDFPEQFSPELIQAWKTCKIKVTKDPLFLVIERFAGSDYMQAIMDSLGTTSDELMEKFVPIRPIGEVIGSVPPVPPVDPNEAPTGRKKNPYF